MLWGRLCCSQSFPITSSDWMGGEETVLRQTPWACDAFPSLWISCRWISKRICRTAAAPQLPTPVLCCLCLLIVLNPLKSWELFWFITCVLWKGSLKKGGGKKDFSTPVYLQSTFLTPLVSLNTHLSTCSLTWKYFSTITSTGIAVYPLQSYCSELQRIQVWQRRKSHFPQCF